MAYELKRQDKIEGVYIDGEEIPVVLDIYHRVNDLRRKQVELIHAQTAIKQAKGTEDISVVEGAYEAFGNAIISILELIFGDDGAQKIVNYYEGKYDELLYEITPYINDVILPHLHEKSAQNRKKYAKKGKFFKR